MARAGTGSRAFGMNTEDSGDLEASKVRFNYPNSIHVTADKILVGSYSGTVDEFNENLFTAANKDTAWLQQMGGGAVSRWTGVKQAMATIALIPNGRVFVLRYLPMRVSTIGACGYNKTWLLVSIRFK